MNLTARRGVAALVAVAVAGVACRESPSPALVQPAAAVPAVARAHLPRSQRELPTTDAGLAVSSFLGLYQLAQETAEEHPRTPPVQLVSLLATHAQYFGRLDDYDAALAAAERIVRLAPAVPEAYLQRAGARQSLHLFAGALADLERARQLGGDGEAIDAGRAGVLAALGRDDEALALRRHLLAQRRTTATLAALAHETAVIGRTAEAEALFLEAQEAFADVSPFPLAWLYFQAGLVEERAGRPTLARQLYGAAHERLPQYAPAAGHLAALMAAAGERASALALLEPLVASSDDPEYHAQLGALLASTDPERSAGLIAYARRRYEALVRRHPEAFADHAARFWLGAGGDGKRALVLARRNLAARPTADAYQLLIEAALAANDSAAACAAAQASARLPHLSAALHVRAGEAFARCRLADRAAAELAAATATR